MKILCLNPYKALEKKLGYRFRNKELLATALMHRSFRFESKGVADDNQRLEFLGDAALSLISTDYVFHSFQNLQEGRLTSLRSRLTSGKALGKVGSAIGLGDQLKLGKGEQKSGGHQRTSNIVDAMEAILGAAYLDGGIKAVSKIFNNLFIPLIAVSPDDIWIDNPKGQLQEVTQGRWKTNPVYHLLSQKGPAHSKVFTVNVIVNNMIAGTGTGLTKQQAEQEAALIAVQMFRKKEKGQ